MVVIDGYGGNEVFAFDGQTVPTIDKSVVPPWTGFEMLDQYVALEVVSDSLGYWILNDQGKIYGVGSGLAEGAEDPLVAEVSPALPAFVPGEGVPGPGLSSAIDFAVVDDGAGIIVLDRWGGRHLIGNNDSAGIDVDTPFPYFGWDIARDIDIEPDGEGALILDGFGGIHPVPASEATYGANPFIPTHVYFGWDAAKKIDFTADGLGLVMLDLWAGRHYDGDVDPVPGLYFEGFDIARDIEIYESTE